MNCPKCGAGQDDLRKECSACGVIFARWMQSRPPAPRVRPDPPSAPSNDTAGTPTGLMVIGLVVALLLGAVWTAKRRSARSGQDPAAALTDQMNEINNKGRSERLRLEAERKKLRQVLPGTPPVPSLPPGLTEDVIRSGIEACAEFRNPVTITLPKSFLRLDYGQTLERYPAFGTAVRDLLVEFDPPFDPAKGSGFDYTGSPLISVNITPIGRIKMRVSDFGDDYEIDLGRRLIESIGAFSSFNATVQVSFRWRFEEEIGSTFRTNERAFVAVADFAEQGNYWNLQRVTLFKEHRSVVLCTQ